jgi:hypothetical protein
MRKNLIAAFALLVLSSAALAQSNAPVVEPGGCGNGLFLQNNGYFTVDPQGRNCGSTAPAGLGWFSYLNITGAATTLVKSGTGVLHNLTFNNPQSTEVVTLFDSLTGSGTKIGTVTVPSNPAIVTLNYDVQFTTGLTIVTATASSDFTVVYK